MRSIIKKADPKTLSVARRSGQSQLQPPAQKRKSFYEIIISARDPDVHCINIVPGYRSVCAAAQPWFFESMVGYRVCCFPRARYVCTCKIGDHGRRVRNSTAADGRNSSLVCGGRRNSGVRRNGQSAQATIASHCVRADWNGRQSGLGRRRVWSRIRHRETALMNALSLAHCGGALADFEDA